MLFPGNFFLPLANSPLTGHYDLVTCFFFAQKFHSHLAAFIFYHKMDIVSLYNCLTAQYSLFFSLLLANWIIESALIFKYLNFNAFTFFPWFFSHFCFLSHKSVRFLSSVWDLLLIILQKPTYLCVCLYERQDKICAAASIFLGFILSGIKLVQLESQVKHFDLCLFSLFPT